MNAHDFTGPLLGLGRSLAELKARLRQAVAAEVAAAVGTSARDIVAAVLGAVSPTPRLNVSSRDPWADDESDPWADEPDADLPEFSAEVAAAPAPVARRPVALAAGLTAGRWWLSRRGSVTQALGVGLLVALAALFGGPAVRAGTAALSAAIGLASAAEALR